MAHKSEVSFAIQLNRLYGGVDTIASFMDRVEAEEHAKAVRIQFPDLKIEVVELPYVTHGARLRAENNLKK